MDYSKTGYPVVNAHTHYHTWETLDEMHENAVAWGIHYCIMKCLSEHDGKSGNEIILDAMRDHGDWLVGLYHLKMDEVFVDEVAKAQELGYGGFKIIGTLKPYDDVGYYPFYEAIEKTGMPIQFHTGYLSCGPEQRGSTVSMLNMRPGRLDTLGRAFPDMKMLGAHMGAPWFDEAVATANFHPNVYFDISGGAVRANSLAHFRRVFSFRDASAPDMKDMEAELPPLEDVPNMQLLRKICFGTDNPPPHRVAPFCKNLLDGLGADEETKKRVWFKNACDLFGLEIPGYTG